MSYNIYSDQSKPVFLLQNKNTNPWKTREKNKPSASLQIFLYSENDKFLSKQEPSYSKLYLSFGF